MLDSFNNLLLHFNFVAAFPSNGGAMTVSYDYWLVTISYLIAAIAGYTGLSLSHLVRERKSLNEHSTGLLVLGSVAMGLGIWAMHFIAMLAYSIGIDISYDPLITGVSVIPAVLASLVALRAMARHQLTWFRLSGYGLVIGLGIGSMHYIGMGAMVQDATPAYHSGIFILSLLVAWVLGAFTLYIRFSPWFTDHLPGIWSNLVSAACWGAAVTGMHYTGMAAAFFTPGCSVQMAPGIPADILATPVALIALVLVLSALAFTQFQRRLMSVSREAEINRERMIEAIEEMSDGFIVTDKDNLISIVNRQILGMFPEARDKLIVGLPFDTFMGWLMCERLADGMTDKTREHIGRCLRTEQTCKDSMELHLADDRWLMLRQSRTRSGAVMRIWTDITTFKQAEEAIFQEDKMESMGRMVAGVAHEVNTPLGISLTLASQLEEETRQVRKAYEGDEVSQEQFVHYLSTSENISEMLLANIRRAAELIRNFKQVAVDQSHLERETITLKHYTEQVIHTLRSEYKALNPSIEVNGPEDLEIETLPGAYSQVIINLIKNSVLHAFEGIEQPKMAIDINVLPKHVSIIYSDNGVGMKKEILDKIFEPFFTTKRQQGGTGLGMHIVFNLVSQKLKGNIKAESQPNAGSRFVIQLPNQLGSQ